MRDRYRLKTCVIDINLKKTILFTNVPNRNSEKFDIEKYNNIQRTYNCDW